MKTLNAINNSAKTALFLAKKQLPELVCDVVNLEGINYTLPEIMTLLDGVTVGGRKQQDELIANNQIKSWNFLFKLLEKQTFKSDKDTACKLHRIVAKDEALTYGEFRTSDVFIAGTDYLPPAANQLDYFWQNNMPTLTIKTNEHIYQYAISLFLQMARHQFFFDGNKRTGRLMMNGILLSYGLPVINLPAKKQLEFNQLMTKFYPTGDEADMQEFMRSCLDKRIINIMINKERD
jgi:Fic family protein